MSIPILGKKKYLIVWSSKIVTAQAAKEHKEQVEADGWKSDTEKAEIPIRGDLTFGNQVIELEGEFGAPDIVPIVNMIASNIKGNGAAMFTVPCIMAVIPLA